MKGLALHLLSIALLSSAPAWAQVGTVTAIDGEATRTPGGGPSVPLSQGDAVQLHDSLEVRRGNLALTLNDGSVMALGAGSHLVIDEATFSGQERRALSVRLLAGAVWSKVTHALAGSGAKFEVVTEQAVAGVRGTVFRVEASAEGPSVGVQEGRVAVTRREAPPGVPQEALVGAGEELQVRKEGNVRMALPARHGELERFLERHAGGERGGRTDEGKERRRDRKERTTERRERLHLR